MDGLTALLLASLGGAVVLFESVMTLARRPTRVAPTASIRHDRTIAYSGVLLRAVPLMIIVAAVDRNGFFLLSGGPLRYLLLLPFISLIIYWALRRVGTPGPVDRISVAFGLFTMVALAGSIVGIASSQTESSPLPVAAGATMAFLHLGVPHVSEDQCLRLVRWLQVSLYLYLAVHTAAAFGIVHSDILVQVGDELTKTNGAYNHEKWPLLAMALYLALRRRSVVFFIACAAAVAAIFISYPAGTYAVGALALGGVTIALRRRRPPLVKLFAALIAVAALIVVQVTGAGSQFALGYYSHVNRVSNVSTRSEIWQATLSAIHKNPLIGSLFAGNATVEMHVGNLPPIVPPHNDYLELLLVGGVVGLAIFLAKVGSTFRQLSEALGLDHLTATRRQLLEVTVVGLTAFLVDFMFNPILLKLNLAAIFFGLIGLVPALIARTGPEEPGGSQYPAPALRSAARAGMQP